MGDANNKPDIKKGSPMTSHERISNIFKRQPVDRIGLYEHFWSDTKREYISKGHMREEDSFEDLLGFDIINFWPFNMMADLDFKDKIVEETDDTVVILDGNGATLRRHKLHDTTPEHVDFTVKTREDWEKYKPLLLHADPRRIDFDGYRQAREKAKRNQRFFTCGGVNVFECMHPIAGHENMLMGMALDPDWILDMCETYSNLIISLQKMLFEREGQPDGIWNYEDMGFKERPFMSPAMYDELIFPSHKKTIDFAHSNGISVIMHSCGFIEPLLPGMIAAGIDCLHVIEVKAGMDLLRIHKNYGDKISLMGGIDVRCLYSNNRRIIDAELEAKIPIVKNGYGYVLHSDHSIPNTVHFDTLNYFIEKGLELGTY